MRSFCIAPRCQALSISICITINILLLKIVSWNLLFYLVLFSSVVCRMRISSTHMLTLIHTMNYPKKPGFNLYQSLHCAYITYSVKTWFFKPLSIAVGNRGIAYIPRWTKTKLIYLSEKCTLHSKKTFPTNWRTGQISLYWKTWAFFYLKLFRKLLLVFWKDVLI